MSETMTYDPGTDTVTTENNLTPDEQDSLSLGQEMQDQQEQLLAGKYKDAEELEKAYVELETKLGQREESKSEETESTTKDYKPTDTEYFTDAEGNQIQSHYSDGSVNYEAVNDVYGKEVGDIFKNGNVDPWRISGYFHDNGGTITEEMYTELGNAGLSRGTVDAYLAGRSTQMGYSSSSVSEDISSEDAAAIRNSVGGEVEYNRLTNWAADNLNPTAQRAFDDLINTGNVGAIQLAVSGLKAQMDNSVGYEGRMLTGKPPQTSGDVFRSQAELVSAMSDSRYDEDPAYRQDVIEKLDRSDIQF